MRRIDPSVSSSHHLSFGASSVHCPPPQLLLHSDTDKDHTDGLLITPNTFFHLIKLNWECENFLEWWKSHKEKHSRHKMCTWSGLVLTVVPSFPIPSGQYWHHRAFISNANSSSLALWHRRPSSLSGPDIQVILRRTKFQNFPRRVSVIPGSNPQEPSWFPEPEPLSTTSSALKNSLMSRFFF